MTTPGPPMGIGILDRQSWVQRVLWVLPALALVIGVSLPGIYDWTGQDQSYHSPKTTFLLFAVLVVATLFSLSLIWWPKPDGKDDRPQFNLRTMLVVTAFSATALASIPILPVLPSIAICVAGYGYAFWRMRDTRDRLSVVSFLCCGLAPFAWVFSFDHPWNTNPLVAGALPGFFASIVTASLTEVNLPSEPQLPALLTGIQMVVALSLSRLGERCSVAINTWTLVFSLFGSSLLHAMIRA